MNKDAIWALIWLLMGVIGSWGFTAPSEFFYTCLIISNIYIAKD